MRNEIRIYYRMKRKSELRGKKAAEGDDSCHNECGLAGEEAYLEAKATLCERVDALKSRPAERGTLADQGVVRQLGDILSQDNLPLFNGDFTQWAAFRDLFRINVHENSNYTNAHLQKIHALKSMRAASCEDLSESFYAV